MHLLLLSQTVRKKLFVIKIIQNHNLAQNRISLYYATGNVKIEEKEVDFKRSKPLAWKLCKRQDY